MNCEDSFQSVRLRTPEWSKINLNEESDQHKDGIYSFTVDLPRGYILYNYYKDTKPEKLDAAGYCALYNIPAMGVFRKLEINPESGVTVSDTYGSCDLCSEARAQND